MEPSEVNSYTSEEEDEDEDDEAEQKEGKERSHEEPAKYDPFAKKK